MTVIETSRLILRPFVAEDADFVFDLFRRLDVSRWSGQGIPMKHRDEAVARIGHLHPDAWGNGYATEAAQALVDRAFASDIPEVYAVTHPDNASSQAVCRRLGMTDLGLRSDWYDRELRAFRLDQP